MKILIFTESLRAGGKERRITELLKAFQGDPDFHFEVVLTKSAIHYEEFLGLGLRWHVIERKWFKKDPRLFFLFLRIATQFKPDVIHVWGHMTAVYALPAKILLGIPLINNEITDSAENKKLLFKKTVFQFSDRILANCIAGLTSYAAPPEKSGVIYNGFSFDRLKGLKSPEELKNQWGIQTRFVVGMVASFLRNKDYSTYIQAALNLLEHRADVTFLCVGDGDDRHYRALVPERFSDRIRFTGKQQQIESIMNACDVGVLTSNTKVHGEGISNALLEFMALGKPIIATDFGGSRELIQNGREGFLIAPFNHLALTEKIQFLLDHAAERIAAGQAGKKTVEQQFSINTMAEHFKNEYRKFFPQQNLLIHENIDDRVTAF